MQLQQPVKIDHNTRGSGLGILVCGFLAGWFVGVLATGIIADMVEEAGRGRHSDGGMYFLAAYAIVIEAPILAALRWFLGAQRVNGNFAFVYGLLIGPLMFGILLAITFVSRLAA